MKRLLCAVGLLLCLQRIVYHAAYVSLDPFALATISDGQLYEEAARDLLAHAPLGTKPFYLQGLYAYVLALGLAVTHSLIGALSVQLALAGGGLWLFHRAARAAFGELPGLGSTVVLLACHELTFYENKYLSVTLGLACNMFAVWAFVRDQRRGTRGSALLLGVASGLACLARPNLVLALPLTLIALTLRPQPPDRQAAARPQGAPRMLRLLGYAAGVVLALLPMAARNQLVVGRAEIFPSHAGAIPIFLGNNPLATGRWSSAGGAVSGQVDRERGELAAYLGLKAAEPAQLDAQIAHELTQRVLGFVTSQPMAWLGLEARKLWWTLGNHRFVRDYDLRGEAELLGGYQPVGLPFGVLLGLGALGLTSLFVSGEPLGLAVFLSGQGVAVLAASLVTFASAQNRVPLAVPLAFVAGPALLSLHTGWRHLPRLGGWHPGRFAHALAACLGLQAFWPRVTATELPSSTHYYNLAVVEEDLGRFEAAAQHYRQAAARNAKEPMFALRLARLERRLGHLQAASNALAKLEALPALPPTVQRALARERAALAAAAGP